MPKPEINIDESTHERAPALTERLTYALVSVIMGFVLIHLVAFWLFPGMGMFGVYTVSRSYFHLLGELVNIYVLAFLVFCGVTGWFRGEYFLNRLSGYLNFWKFW